MNKGITLTVKKTLPVSSPALTAHQGRAKLVVVDGFQVIAQFFRSRKRFVTLRICTFD